LRSVYWVFRRKEDGSVKAHYSLLKFAVSGLAAVVVLALALTGATATSAAAQAPQTPGLTVLVPALNVRSGPGTGYPVISGLRQGNQAPIVGRHSASGWWQVKPGSGATGWVSGSPALVRVSGDTAAVPEVPAPPMPARAATARKGLLVFQLSNGGPIYVVNPDGSGLRALTTGMDPAMSSDGRQVAVTRWAESKEGSPGSVWVINTDGSGERNVHDSAVQPRSPVWSPDGKQIMVTTQQGGRLFPEKGYCGRKPPPADATNITYEVKCDASGCSVKFCYDLLPRPGRILRSINLETGAVQDQPVSKYSYTPAWDPANSWRVIYRDEQGLAVLDANRGVTWRLTEESSDYTPVFSPDGKKIAVGYRQHDHWEIHVMNADGGGRVRLTETPLEVTLAGKPAWNNVAPAWSPDGSKIAFLTDRSGRWEIWTMGADGSNQRPLLPASVGAKVALQHTTDDDRSVSW
jgi:dipeptidyl aminopeptidase/acylaminoacyl peptidase